MNTTNFKTFACVLNKKDTLLKIISPTGKYVTFNTQNIDQLNGDQRIVIHRCINHNSLTIDLTIWEMNQLKSIKIKRVPCEHPRKKTKNHGSWVGWYCPDCGAGGSKSKKLYQKI